MRWARKRLGEELARGTEPGTSPELMVRAAQLRSRSERFRLANALVEAVGDEAPARRGCLVIEGKTCPSGCAKKDVDPKSAERAPAHREAAGVVAWRRGRLRQAGFDGELAERLSRDCAVDLHALIELVERGCAPPLAARILAPLDHERRPC